MRKAKGKSRSLIFVCIVCLLRLRYRLMLHIVMKLKGGVLRTFTPNNVTSSYIWIVLYDDALFVSVRKINVWEEQCVCPYFLFKLLKEILIFFMVEEVQNVVGLITALLCGGPLWEILTRPSSWYLILLKVYYYLKFYTVLYNNLLPVAWELIVELHVFFILVNTCYRNDKSFMLLTDPSGFTPFVKELCLLWVVREKQSSLSLSLSLHMFIGVVT